MALGTFDNFNHAMAGLKGLFAAAAGTICDTLMASSLEEVEAHYGLIAEAVSHPRTLRPPPFACAPPLATTTASRLRSRT